MSAASKLGVGIALSSPVSGGAWSQANAKAALQQARAQYGIRKVYLWVEDSDLSSGAGATFVANALSVL